MISQGPIGHYVEIESLDADSDASGFLLATESHHGRLDSLTMLTYLKWDDQRMTDIR